MLSRTQNFLLQGSVILLPATLILYFIVNSGPLPDYDYWGVISHIVTKEGDFSSDFSDWIRRGNEHYILLPKLVYAFNILLSSGNNIGLGLFAWFAGLLQVLLLRQFIPVSGKQRPFLFLVFLFVIAVFIFNPRQSHNWILGMSGTAWILANLLSIAAIFTLQRYVTIGHSRYFWATLLFIFLAVATYSTSLALLPTLFIAVFLLPLKAHERLIIVIFGLAIVCGYFITYETPENHPEIQRTLSKLSSYMFAFLGALFTKHIDCAIVIGVLGGLSTIFMLAYAYLRKPELVVSILPWFFIQLFAGGNGLMAALARSGFGIEQAFSSRYGSLPALFWLGWLMMAGTLCLALSQPWRKYMGIFLTGLGVLMIVFNYQVSMKGARSLLSRAEYKERSMISLYSRAYDMELLHYTILPHTRYDIFEDLVDLLEARQHIPFNRVFEDCPRVGEQLTKIKPSLKDRYFGSFDKMEWRNGRIAYVKGWAYTSKGAPLCIALLNQNHVVRGLALGGLERKDVAKARANVLSDYSGWQGYGKVHNHDKILQVYMLAQNHYWIPLSGRFEILSQPPYFKKM